MSRKQRRSSLTSRASDHAEGGVGQRTAGWLLKKASSHGMWQPRYFALIGHYLMYAKKKSKRGSAQSWEGGVELRGKEAVIARAKIDGHAALRITGLDGQLDNHDDVLRTMEVRFVAHVVPRVCVYQLHLPTARTGSVPHRAPSLSAHPHSCASTALCRAQPSVSGTRRARAPMGRGSQKWMMATSGPCRQRRAAGLRVAAGLRSRSRPRFRFRFRVPRCSRTAWMCSNGRGGLRSCPHSP